MGSIRKFSLFLATSMAMAAAMPAWAADTTATLTFDGSKPIQSAKLTDTESHTLYKSEQVPDTCYRTIDDGTTTECRTVYHDECSTTYREECGTVYHDECSTTYHDECSGGGTSCQRVQGPDGVWRDECSTSSPTCQRVPSQECSRVPSTECSQVPEQSCTRVPSEECEQVPHSHQEAYACTKTIQVPIGEELDFNVTANVTVNFSEVPAGVTPAEKLTVTLDHGNVLLASAGLSGKLLLFVQQSVTSATTKPDQGPSSPGEKVVTAVFNIKLVDAKAVVGGVQGGISEVAIKGNTLSFSLGKVAAPDFLKLALVLDRDKLFGSKKLYSDDLAKGVYSLKDVGDRTQVSVALDRLDLGEQIKKGSNYIVDLTATIDKSAGGSDATLLNPENLADGQAKATKLKIKAQ